MLEFYDIERGLLIVKFSDRENTGFITQKNWPHHLVYPKKFGVYNHCLRFLLARLECPGEIENSGYAKFRG